MLSDKEQTKLKSDMLQAEMCFGRWVGQGRNCSTESRVMLDIAGSLGCCVRQKTKWACLRY